MIKTRKEKMLEARITRLEKMLKVKHRKFEDRYTENPANWMDQILRELDNALVDTDQFYGNWLEPDDPGFERVSDEIDDIVREMSSVAKLLGISDSKFYAKADRDLDKNPSAGDIQTIADSLKDILDMLDDFMHEVSGVNINKVRKLFDAVSVLYDDAKGDADYWRSY